MGIKLQIDCPNGRQTATVNVLDENGNVRLTDQGKLGSIKGRQDLAERVARHLQDVSAADILEKLTRGWADVATVKQQQKNAPRQPRSVKVECTDWGNAQRLVGRHGENFRHCYPWKKDLVWDGIAWRCDATGQLERWAKDVTRALLIEAAAEANEARQKGLAEWALESQDARRLRAMASLARSEEGIPILPDVLDTNHMLLCCPNATLDLATGQGRPHRREDYLSKRCPTPYDPAATCPRWKRFLEDIFPAQGDAAEQRGDPELIGFMQRLCGYFLTGDVREQVLPIFWGSGSNGKSTFINTLLDVLGPDYGLKANRDLLMTRKDDRHPTVVAQLHGKRLVVCTETAEDGRLDEVLIKELTGGDPLNARRMREDPWSFLPTHKPVLCTNHTPRVRGTDHAIWRRLRLVPFVVTFPDDRQDKQLPDKLKAEAPGILAWCVRGCLDWQRQGLGLPSAVRIATCTYRDEQDLVGRFLAERCITGPDYRCRASDLYAAFRAWCEMSGEATKQEIPTQRNLGEALTERKVERYKNNGTWYRGLGLHPLSDDETATV